MGWQGDERSGGSRQRGLRLTMQRSGSYTGRGGNLTVDNRLKLELQPIDEGAHTFTHSSGPVHHLYPAVPRHCEQPVAQEAKRLTQFRLTLNFCLNAPNPLCQPIGE